MSSNSEVIAGGTSGKPEKFWLDLGARIARSRREGAWNQRELASKAGLSRQRLSRIENGRARLQVAELIALSAALDSSLDDLVLVRKQEAPRQRAPLARLFRELERLAMAGHQHLIELLLRALVDAIRRLDRRAAEAKG